VVIGSNGFVVDGYVSGATVVCDVNSNGASDAGEATTTTDTTGFFKFASACASTLMVTGGTNTDTKLPFVGKLMAPAGSTMITPLTTLVSQGLTMDQINTALGLPAGTNIGMLDPARKVAGELVNADLFRKTLVVQQVLQKTAETLAALTGSSDVAAMYSQASAAMASVMRNSATSSLVTGAGINEAVVSAVVKAAATQVKAAVNADSLAQVMGKAITVQATAINSATNAQAITDATTLHQSSKAIQDFVVSKKTDLAGAPGDAITALQNQLVTQIGGGTPPPPPPPPPAPPPVSGTLLLSFDESTPVFTGMGAYGGAKPEVSEGPAGGSGSALKIVKPASPDTWGGTFFGVPAIPFTADRKVITARVYSTRANAVIKFKVEVAGGKISTEVASAPVPANTWTTVSWDFKDIDTKNTYATIAITPDQDVPTSGQSYYIDDIALAPAAIVEPPAPPVSCSSSTEQCVSFSETTAGAHAFEGLVSAEVVTDMQAATNKVLKMVKGPGGQPWAGATVYTMSAADGDKTIRTVPNVGLNASKNVMVRAYSGAPIGTIITLKLENSISGKSVFAEAKTTKLNEWETLTFDFAKPSRDQVDANVTYNMASLFPAFSEIGGSQAALTANTTFYFDELKYAVATITPPPPPPAPAPSPSNLVTNGDFSNGVTGWSGNAVQVRTEGGNSFNFADVATAGPPYNVNLSYVLNIPTSGVAYKLRFKASSNRNRTMVAGIGLNQDPWTNTTQTVNLTTTQQPFELALTSNFASPTSRVIFDMGADTGNVVIDDVELVLDTAAPAPAPAGGPTAAAPVPTLAATIVKSIFSDSYPNVTGITWGPDWGPASARVTDAVVAGNNYKTIDMTETGKEFVGISFPGSKFDATTYTTFHVSYWIDTPVPAGQVLNIKLSNHDGSGETSAIQKMVSTITGGSWQQIEIPLSTFEIAGGGSASRNNIAEVILTAARAQTGSPAAMPPVKIHFDNMFFSSK